MVSIARLRSGDTQSGHITATKLNMWQGYILSTDAKSQTESNDLIHNKDYAYEALYLFISLSALIYPW